MSVTKTKSGPLSNKRRTNAERVKNALLVKCDKCRMPPGKRCQNYLGKGKAPCPERMDAGDVLADQTEARTGTADPLPKADPGREARAALAEAQRLIAGKDGKQNQWMMTRMQAEILDDWGVSLASGFALGIGPDAAVKLVESFRKAVDAFLGRTKA